MTTGIPRGGKAIGPGIDVSALQWRCSSSQGSGQGVEMAALPNGLVAMRYAGDPSGQILVYTPEEIDALIRGVKNGEFDHLLPNPAADS